MNPNEGIPTEYSWSKDISRFITSGNVSIIEYTD